MDGARGMDGGFGVLKPVKDPSAEVMESIRRKIPANRDLTLRAPGFRLLNPAAVWDERKFSLAGWRRLREILASEKSSGRSGRIDPAICFSGLWSRASRPPRG